MPKQKPILITGDRPTGRLHLGHLVGSLEARVALQRQYESYFLVADYQVLYDHLEDSHQVRALTHELVLDWLSVGMDPNQATFFQQSAIPQIGELVQYFSYLVTIARLRRNPTVKEEAVQAGQDADSDRISLGFLAFPVSQAADILFLKGELVPVGEDQLPHLEQTRELARSFNRAFGQFFPEPKPLLSKTPRLPGLDGKKMSKSRGNAIFLTDSPAEITKKLQKAKGDPKKIHVSDPGDPKECVPCQYLEVFAPEQALELNRGYAEGKLGGADIKAALAEILEAKLAPIRAARADAAAKPKFVDEILAAGNEKARHVGEQTLQGVRELVFGK